MASLHVAHFPLECFNVVDVQLPLAMFCVNN